MVNLLYNLCALKIQQKYFIISNFLSNHTLAFLKALLLFTYLIEKHKMKMSKAICCCHKLCSKALSHCFKTLSPTALVKIKIKARYAQSIQVCFTIIRCLKLYYKCCTFEISPLDTTSIVKSSFLLSS